MDSFKNLLQLKVDLGPFTSVAGENGAGKSNVFDAMDFLALLADRTLMEAAQEVRGSEGDRAADPRDLFWNRSDEERPRMRFAAEMLVPAATRDDFGRRARPSITFLRYEREIA